MFVDVPEWRYNQVGDDDPNEKQDDGGALPFGQVHHKVVIDCRGPTRVVFHCRGGILAATSHCCRIVIYLRQRKHTFSTSQAVPNTKNKKG